jgi:Kef-type K+ transport system membrane component KefB
VLEDEIPSLVLLLAIALLTPIIADLPKKVRVPAVVLELLLGIIVGPDVLGWAERDQIIDFLSQFGLAFLMFLAGFEIDFDEVKGPPLTQAAKGWAVSVVLGLSVGTFFVLEGFALSGLVIGLCLTTTALGTLLPILRDEGEVGNPYGTRILAIGAAGEFGPIVAIAVLLSTDAPATSVLMLTAFTVIAVLAIAFSHKPLPKRVQKVLHRTMRTSGQLVVRLALVVLALLVLAARDLGLDVLLGAFTAGIVFRSLVYGVHDHEEMEVVEAKLEAVGFGFLIPIFFIVSGMKFDLDALLDSPTTIAKLPLFLACFLFVRGLPTWFFARRDLPKRSVRALAIMASAALPLVVVITEIGVSTGRMKPGNAAALVGAGMLSVLIFPLVAGKLRAKDRAEGLVPAIAVADPERAIELGDEAAAAEPSAEPGADAAAD